MLEKKKFSDKWIGWILSAVEGGRVAINLNGERGEYFRSYKELRQGDPLSPLLFNLVGDALSEMLNYARRNNIITGLIPELVEGGLTHLHYADDTILFLANSEENFAMMKFLLFCFEELSGLRINYNKSEVFGVGIDKIKLMEVADGFNCRVGSFQ